MLTIDGAKGEGGGQVLRTSLSLSMATGTPVRVTNIRAGRSKPGLLRQHLTALQASAMVSSAAVEGANLGSTEITFRPGTVRGGEYAFAVGSAGSATLVLQTVLPALMLAKEKSSLVLEGGTHNPQAPPFEFLSRAFLPLLSRTGPTVVATLERYGFYPAGGGRISVTIEPSTKLQGFELDDAGAVVSQTARALVSGLPKNIADRQVHTIGQQMQWGREQLHAEGLRNAVGPGNVVMIELANEHVTEVFIAFGKRGLRADWTGPHVGLCLQATQATQVAAVSETIRLTGGRKHPAGTTVFHFPARNDFDAIAYARRKDRYNTR